MYLTAFRNAGKNIQNALADYIDEGAALNEPKNKADLSL